MKVLVINCGSSSLKYQLFHMEHELVLAKGLVERIGQEQGKIVHQTNKEDSLNFTYPITNHEHALKLMFEKLINNNYGVITSFADIDVIGHRVVHGGTEFKNAVIIDDDVKDAVRKLFLLAPLHNPPNLIGIEACEKLVPNVQQVAVFDTAFHQTIPEHAYQYGISYDDYLQYDIRKYGFHGTSHRYVSNRAAEIVSKEAANLKVISCHLGNGASITAVKNGKSIDTSMGLTPLEGLIMGTRSGDIDPAIIPLLMDRKDFSVKEINNYLNKSCGVFGISGVSSDFRDVEKAALEGNKRAILAIDMFSYRVKKYIGYYVAILNGLDVLVFTAGLGENSSTVREKICHDLDFLGIKLDINKNNSIRGIEGIISTDNSSSKIIVVPTNEELMIARDAKKLILQNLAVDY